MIGKNIQLILKKNGMSTLIKSLVTGKKVFGFIIKTILPILLALTICTCSGPRLMLGNQILEKQIDYSTSSGKHAKLMPGLMVCATSKTDVLDFHSWPLANASTWRQCQRIHGLGFCPNLVPMQKKCSQTRLYQYPLTTRSFSNQYKTVWTDLKPNLRTEYLPLNLLVESLTPTKHLKKLPVLTPQLIGKTQVTTAYDGEKLKLLVHDESGKWERPNNILNNWRVTKTTLRLGSKVIGKCMMGSTSNALDKGGDNFKKLYNSSDVTKRNANGQTSSGLYSLFIPMEWNYEGYIDSYGVPVFNTPKKPAEDPHGTK